MSAANNGGDLPAFPLVVLDPISGQTVDQHFGLTIRDAAALKAMQACVEGHIAHYGHDNHWPPKDVAEYAYQLADAMLAERAK